MYVYVFLQNINLSLYDYFAVSADMNEMHDVCLVESPTIWCPFY